MHPQAVLPRLNQACASEVSQMSRNLWLGATHDGHEIADARLAPTEQVQDAQSRSIRERSEHEINAIGYGQKHIRISVCNGGEMSNIA